MKVAMWKDGVVVIKGHPADVREKVEDLILEKLGFSPALQETDPEEDEEYLVYLHTDSYEDLNEEQLNELDRLGITEDPEPSTLAIQTFLGVVFTIQKNI